MLDWHHWSPKIQDERKNEHGPWIKIIVKAPSPLTNRQIKATPSLRGAPLHGYAGNKIDLQAMTLG